MGRTIHRVPGHGTVALLSMLAFSQAMAQTPAHTPAPAVQLTLAQGGFQQAFQAGLSQRPERAVLEARELAAVNLFQAARMAQGPADGTVIKQSSMMAFADTFWFMGMLCFALFPLIFLLRRSRAQGPVVVE